MLTTNKIKEKQKEYRLLMTDLWWEGLKFEEIVKAGEKFIGELLREKKKNDKNN